MKIKRKGLTREQNKNWIKEDKKKLQKSKQKETKEL
jgi:hypothetical protein